MPVSFSTSGNVAVINMSGEFDYSSQDALNQIFTKVLGSPQSRIEIDLKLTAFIDSSIIRMFLKLQEAAKRNKKSLKLKNCNKRIFEIFTIGGFDQIFDIQ